MRDDKEPMTEKSERPRRTVPSGGRIEILRGFYEGLEVPLDRDWLVLGRGRGSDLVLAEPTLSRAHAAVGYDRDGFFVQDLGSTNGSLVNGQRLTRAVLADGDEVQIGKLRIRIHLPDPPRARS